MSDIADQRPDVGGERLSMPLVERVQVFAAERLSQLDEGITGIHGLWAVADEAHRKYELESDMEVASGRYEVAQLMSRQVAALHEAPDFASLLKEYLGGLRHGLGVAQEPFHIIYQFHADELPIPAAWTMKKKLAVLDGQVDEVISWERVLS